MGGAKRRFDVTSVDPSEYEPQVVELSEQLIQHDSPPSEEEKEPSAREGSGKDDHPERSKRESNDNTPTDGARKDNVLATVTGSKSTRWLSKLQKLRQQFTTPPTD